MVVETQLPEGAALGDALQALLLRLRARIDRARLIFCTPQPEELGEGTVGVGLGGVAGEQIRQMRPRRWRRGKREVYRRHRRGAVRGRSSGRSTRQRHACVALPGLEAPQREQRCGQQRRDARGNRPRQPVRRELPAKHLGGGVAHQRRGYAVTVE